VDVDRVIPAAAAVPEVQISRVPNLGAAEMRPKSAASMSPPSVLMPHGPKNDDTGSKVFCSGAACRTRSALARDRDLRQVGFGIITAGTWLTSGVAGLRTMRNSRNRPTQGSAELPESASASVRSSRHALAVLVLGEVHHVDLLPDAVAREVDDDVVALGDALLVELGERHGRRQQVAVVRDLDHRRPSESAILKKRDTLAFRMRKRYLRRSTSKNGL
jgi:hypothetical protein